MAIVQNLEEVEQALAWPDINLVGMELQASTKEDDLFRMGLIRRLAEAGVFAWANAIKLRPPRSRHPVCRLRRQRGFGTGIPTPPGGRCSEKGSG